MLKIKIVEKEVDTVWGEKEIERTTLVLVEGKADKYCLKIVEYSKDGKEWHNRSIGYSLGDKKFNETDGNVILLESIDAEQIQLLHKINELREKLRELAEINRKINMLRRSEDE